MYSLFTAHSPHPSSGEYFLCPSPRTVAAAKPNTTQTCFEISYRLLCSKQLGSKERHCAYRSMTLLQGGASRQTVQKLSDHFVVGTNMHHWQIHTSFSPFRFSQRRRCSPTPRKRPGTQRRLIRAPSATVKARATATTRTTRLFKRGKQGRERAAASFDG